MYLFESYDKSLQRILSGGEWKSNKRTGVRTLAICGVQARFRLDQVAFPVMTRRKYFPRSVFAELLWFLSGSTNNEDLKKLGCNFWTPWVSEEFEKKNGFAPGSFGPVYGFQLRHFGGYYGDGVGGMNLLEKQMAVAAGCEEDTDSYKHSYGFGGFDQLAFMVNRIKEDASCRRVLFDLWSPSQVQQMRLAPCHYSYQVMIDDQGRMSGHLTQRSNDYPVGVPANIQFYSALTCMIAQQTGYTPYEFVHEAVDAHIYENQIKQVVEYLDTPVIDSPSLKLNKATDIYSYKLKDFQLEGFLSGPKIDIPVAV